MKGNDMFTSPAETLIFTLIDGGEYVRVTRETTLRGDHEYYELTIFGPWHQCVSLFFDEDGQWDTGYDHGEW